MTLLQLESCLCSCCFLRVIFRWEHHLCTNHGYHGSLHTSWFGPSLLFSFTMLPFKTHTSKKIKKSQSPSIWQLLQLRRLRLRMLSGLGGLGTIHVQHQVVGGQPRGLLGARNVSRFARFERFRIGTSSLPRSNWLASL